MMHTQQITETFEFGSSTGNRQSTRRLTDRKDGTGSFFPTVLMNISRVQTTKYINFQGSGSILVHCDTAANCRINSRQQFRNEKVGSHRWELLSRSQMSEICDDLQICCREKVRKTHVMHMHKKSTLPHAKVN
jgi:hypothetical protein